MLLERYAQFGGALLDLFFQIGVGLLQLAGHVVELIGQRLDFVAALDRNALAEIAAADARRAGAQHLDWHHHPSRQEHAGDKRERQRDKQDVTGAQDRAVKGCVSLFDRGLDEHEPAERVHRRVGGQYFVAADIVRFPHRLGRGARPRAPHLRQSRHVGVAQDQADVRMRDQPAGGIDHIGAAVLADLDLGHHIPDQLEIDLRDAHPGIAPGAGKRQRHVRLGLAAKVNRAVIDFMRHGLREFRLLGVVDAASNHVHCQTRDLELLMARSIDLGQLRDRRDLAQQPQGVETALIERAVGPRQLRGPAHLAFDLGDELFDLVGGGNGLLLLNADQ